MIPVPAAVQNTSTAAAFVARTLVQITRAHDALT
jgi:hypothetical protein